MINHHLSEFIDQLRKTDFAFPLLQQHGSGTIYITRYAVQENEAGSIAAALEEQLSLSSVIENLQYQLENEAIPDNRNLLDYIQNLHKIFSGYANEGPYSTRYFTGILSSLNSFQGLVQRQSQRDKELLTTLQLLLPAPGKNIQADFQGENMSAGINYKVRYVEQLQKHHEIFNDFLQQESEKKQGLQVITRSEQYLMNLTAMIDQSIYHSRSMRKSLHKFKHRLRLAEKQILYN
jgi:hypothetical protein